MYSIIATPDSTMEACSTPLEALVAMAMLDNIESARARYWPSFTSSGEKQAVGHNWLH